MATIQLDSVWKVYGAVEAVVDLSLTCPDGKMLALLGPSGCGKSSTLKMIAGVEEVTRGDILFDGRSVASLEPGERNLAMVFEDYALYPHLSVFENIAFPLRLRGFSQTEIDKRVRQALALLGLEQWSGQGVKALSGGAQQRVSIGRALVRDPELILFDEPLSHLDADQKVYLRTEIKRLQQESGLTSILVTHDQTEAIAMADQVAIMNGGVLQQIGTPQDLYAAPANVFVANFIGEPPINLLTGQISTAGAQMHVRGAGWSVAVDRAIAAQLSGALSGSEVILGIRPEHILVAQEGPDETSIGARFFYRETRGDVDVVLVDLESRDAAAPVRLAIETPGPMKIQQGDPAALRFPVERLLFFDAGSGRNVLPSLQA
ncbi:MAG: ABC transporter ATP-binding protein [Hyphomonadaceae bacterium]|jgi:ABC-type sugar transport system ATPase subunit|nr:ABC transporter ATP-binding protein [Hyphomonadaceae bacterium]